MALDPIVRTYDAKLNIVTFGALIMSGFAEGDHILISQPDDSFVSTRGADGGIDRSNMNVHDVEVTLRLKASSPLNDQLTALHKADKLTNTGKLPLVIKNLNSALTTLNAPQAWITKYPDEAKAQELGVYEWVLKTGVAVYNPAGNVL